MCDLALRSAKRAKTPNMKHLETCADVKEEDVQEKTRKHAARQTDKSRRWMDKSGLMLYVEEKKGILRKKLLLFICCSDGAVFHVLFHHRLSSRNQAGMGTFDLNSEG